MHGSFLGISAIHCSKMLGHPAFGPHGDPVVFSGPTHPKEIQKLWNQEMLTSLGALLLCFSDGANVQRLDDCSMCMETRKSSKETRWLFLGGWAGVICIWSRLLHNGACLLLITAFYEPRSREKPDSTLAFQSFLGLNVSCTTLFTFRVQIESTSNGFLPMVYALWLRLCWQAQALHTCMNKWIHSNAILEMETPYVFLKHHMSFCAFIGGLLKQELFIHFQSMIWNHPTENGFKNGCLYFSGVQS